MMSSATTKEKPCELVLIELGIDARREAAIGDVECSSEVFPTKTLLKSEAVTALGSHAY